MKTIEYRIEGIAIADEKCEQVARDFLLQPGDGHMVVSSEIFITAVRVLIREGVVSNRQIRFLFRGQYLYLTSDGRSDTWPEGFCDCELMLLSRLMS